MQGRREVGEGHLQACNVLAEQLDEGDFHGSVPDTLAMQHGEGNKHSSLETQHVGSTA